MGETSTQLKEVAFQFIILYTLYSNYGGEIMTEEELRQAYTDLQNKHTELQQNFDTLQNKITSQTEEITNLNSTISDLKVKNYDLFLKVSNPIPTTPQETNQEVNTMSTSDIVYKLINS